MVSAKEPPLITGVLARISVTVVLPLRSMSSRVIVITGCRVSPDTLRIFEPVISIRWSFAPCAWAGGATSVPPSASSAAAPTAVNLNILKLLSLNLKRNVTDDPRSP
ncbi:MAG: hypothetical protein ACK5ZF_10250 [Betaproteobacteria bacterium]